MLHVSVFFIYSDEDDDSDGDVKPQKKMLKKVSQL